MDTSLSKNSDDIYFKEDIKDFYYRNSNKNIQKYNTIKLFDDKFINKENLSLNKKLMKKFSYEELSETYFFSYLFFGTYHFRKKTYMVLNDEDLIFYLNELKSINLKHEHIEKILYTISEPYFYIQIIVGLSTHYKIKQSLNSIYDKNNLGYFRSNSDNAYENKIIAKLSLGSTKINILKEKLIFFFENNLDQNENVKNIFEEQAKYVFKKEIKERNIKVFDEIKNDKTNFNVSVKKVCTNTTIDSDSIIFLDDNNYELAEKIDFNEIENHEILYWFDHDEEITINKNDVYCLKEGNYLNDKIIEFYLMYIKYKLIPIDIQKKTYIFSTFFFSKLLSFFDKINTQRINIEEIYNSVKNWTKNVDIFNYDFLIVPIFKNFHWSLILICYPNKLLNSQDEQILDEDEFQKPCLIFMDSMDYKTNCYNYFKLLRIFLEQELYAKKKIIKNLNEKTLFTLIPQVPIQLNSYDCGIFVLHYVELFLKNPFIIFNNKRLSSISLQNWFNSSSLNNKRKEIFKILKTIFSNDDYKINKKVILEEDSKYISDDEIEILSDDITTF